jgi:hypothetical protein
VDSSLSNSVDAVSGGATRITFVWEGILVGGEVSAVGVWISIEVESGVIVGVDSGVGSET